MMPWDARLQLLADAARVRPSHVHHLIAAMADSGEAFDPSAFAIFARLDLRHVEAIMTALRAHPSLAKAKRRGSESRHATRLPPALQLPDDWLAYAQDKRRWDKATTEDVLADFIEHWSNRQDARAAKINWALTWQTWVRRDRRLDGDWSPNVLTPEQQHERMARLKETLRGLGRE